MINFSQWKDVLHRRLTVKHNGLTMVEASHIARVCSEAGYVWRERTWTPWLVILTFLQQVLSSTKSCRAGVAAALTQLVASGYEGRLPSADDSPYCQARLRLPLRVMTTLMRQTSDAFCDAVDEGRRWCGRVVRVLDGSSVSMPDTPSLQKVFPQVAGQTRGCGFPTARMVAMFNWSTGSIVDLVVDSLNVGEIQLARRLWPHLGRGDILLGDRLYGSYADFCKLLERGVDTVSRKHQRRKVDYRAGKRLGKYDRETVWERPTKSLRPRGMTVDEWEQLPETLTVRVLRVAVTVPGFRSQIVDITTTLLDPKQYSAHDIAQLYRDRWVAEINLRSLKTHLRMEVLRSKSPDMVRKELAMHVIAYNLIRLLMYEAARQHRRDLHRLSFAGTMHRLDLMIPLMCLGAETCEQLLVRILRDIARDTLPNRPNRREPRRVKRRPKGYSLLTRPRAEYKARKGDIDHDAR